MCRNRWTAHGVCLLRKLDPDVKLGSYSRPDPKDNDNGQKALTITPDCGGLNNGQLTTDD